MVDLFGIYVYFVVCLEVMFGEKIKILNFFDKCDVVMVEDGSYKIWIFERINVK